ncbi:MAG: caspase family protein [Fimbriimonadaceae bacterium]|nr:caspase family protein [Fimbriimonadaceae bacterium]
MKKLLTIAALCLVSVAAYAETYALSMGINDYLPGKDESGKEVDFDLKGCVNDAKVMRGFFIDKYGVKASNARMLLDKDANADKFLDAVRWLISTAKPGDQVVFSYSGHGGQVEDEDEEDGIEEVIVLADDMLVPGDLFNEIANTLKLNGVNCTFIFDSCFSGGMSRNIDGKVRISNKSMGMLKPKSATAATKVKNGFMQIKSRQMAPGTKTKAESVFLFASKEDKPSKDISGLEGIEAHGLFTLLLMDMINEDKNAPIKSIYEYMDEALKEINQSFKDNGMETQFDQGPNFEASSGDRANKPIILP